MKTSIILSAWRLDLNIHVVLPWRQLHMHVSRFSTERLLHSKTRITPLAPLGPHLMNVDQGPLSLFSHGTQWAMGPFPQENPSKCMLLPLVGKVISERCHPIKS